MRTKNLSGGRLAGPAIATLLLIPVAGVITWNLMQSGTMTAIPPHVLGGEAGKEKDSDVLTKLADEELKAKTELVDKLGRQNEAGKSATRSDQALVARKQAAPVANGVMRALQAPQSQEFSVAVLPPRPEPHLEREQPRPDRKVLDQSGQAGRRGTRVDLLDRRRYRVLCFRAPAVEERRDA